MKESTLTLPRIKLECLRCRNTWKQALPRWDRGHLLMKRGGRVIFVMDDLGYAFGESIQSVVAPLLQTIGFADFGGETCPGCGRTNARVPVGFSRRPVMAAKILRVQFFSKKTSYDWARNGSCVLRRLKR